MGDTLARSSAAEGDGAAELRVALIAARRDLDRVTRELQRAEHRLAVERWRLRARAQRRSGRIVAAVENSDTVRDWFLLPLRILRAIFTPAVRSPRPLPPGSRRDPQTAEIDVAIAAAREAFESGDDEPALTLARELEPLASRDPVVWKFIQRTYLRAGAVSDHLRVLRMRVRLAPSRSLQRAEAKELGRQRELDPRWFPHLPGTGTYVPVAGRVLHVIKESAPYLTNGYTMRSAYTVSSQAAAGLDPVVITSLGFPRTMLEEVTESDVAPTEVSGVMHHRLDLGPTYPYGDTPWDQALEDALVVAQPLVERLRPQIIQAGSGFRGIETALLGLALARRYDLPFVYEVRSFLEHTWTAELDRSERGEHFERRSAREVQLMLEADHVITIAEAMKADLVSRGVPHDHISIVPNGVDTSLFVPRPMDPALAAQLGLPPGAPVVGYVSNLGQREGIEVLIDAVLALRSRGREVVGLIIGDGPMREELEERLVEAGDPGAVVLPGRVPHDQVQEYYALIDVFVIPRLDDRAARLVTPLKPFEAMALERPMVVSDLPALREIVAPNDRGYTFSPGNASDLAGVLDGLLSDPAERRRIALAGRKWVERERDWVLNGPRYRQVFGRVLAARGD